VGSSRETIKSVEGYLSENPRGSKQKSITLGICKYTTKKTNLRRITMQILTGASKIVNLVVSVSKCALPTSTVFPCNCHHITLIINANQIHTIKRRQKKTSNTINHLAFISKFTHTFTLSSSFVSII